MQDALDRPVSCRAESAAPSLDQIEPVAGPGQVAALAVDQFPVQPVFALLSVATAAETLGGEFRALAIESNHQVVAGIVTESDILADAASCGAWAARVRHQTPVFDGDAGQVFPYL